MSGQLQLINIRTPPVRKGIWVFPWPFFDWFFAYHRWNLLLPKRLQDKEIIKIEDYDTKIKLWDEREAWIKKAIKEGRGRIKTIWHGGPFYARIPPDKTTVDELGWYRYERVKDYIEVATKQTQCLLDNQWGSGEKRPMRCAVYNTGPHRPADCGISVDNWECFLPVT